MANKAIHILDEIIGSSNGTIDVVNQVATASDQQASAAEYISKNLEGISNVTQESVQGIQQIAKASEDLSSLTMNLQSIVNKFTTENRNSGNKSIGKSNLAVRANGKLIHS